MVSIKLKKDIRQIIGKGIATKFYDYLVNKGIRKENKEYYSKAHLRTYIYSEMNNSLLDEEFLKFSQSEIKKFKKLQSEKEELQENIKTFA